MPRAASTTTKKRTPRPKKKVVAFLVSDCDDCFGFMVKSQDEIGDAIKKIQKKQTSRRYGGSSLNDYDYQVRCVAEDGTIKCATFSIAAEVIKAKVTAPAGFQL